MTALETRPRPVAIPRGIWVLMAAAFAISVGYGLIAPVLPQYAQSFNVGITAASLVVSVFAAARLIFAPVGGALIGRLGERRIYLSGLIIVALSTAATAFAQSYWQLLVFRGLGGIGSTMFSVSAMALMIKLAPPDARGRVSSLYASTFLLGGVSGPLLGGLAAGLGYHVPFIVYAVALVVATVLVKVLLPATVSEGQGEGAQLPAVTIREAWAVPVFRAAALTAFAHGFSNYGVRISLVPLLVTQMMHGAPWAAGVVLGAYAAGNAAALSVSGRWADQYGRRPLVLVGLAISGLSTVAIGWCSSLVLVLVVSVVAGVGAGVLAPAEQASIADAIGNERSGGKAVAMVQMIQDAGTISGPILIGAIAQTLGFGPAMSVAGVVLLLALPLWITAQMPKVAQELGEQDANLARS